MAYTIHMGNVPLRAPDGTDLGAASMDDVAYIVVEPATLFTSGRDCWYTDIACNSALPPEYENRPGMLEEHVDWALFDDTPKTAYIPEIGYQGVCRWQHDRDQPAEHQQRSKKRMSEFMVKDHLRMDEVCCIILKNHVHAGEVSGWVAASEHGIPVLVKPDCFF